jgi:hypothetical protein
MQNSTLLKVKVKVTLQLTVNQSVSLGVELHLGLLTRYLLSFDSYGIFFFLWGTLSDERTGLYFVYAAGSCQRSPSWVRFPWDSRQYFTVSDVRLPFSSPTTTCRVTVEVLESASTRVSSTRTPAVLIITSHYGPHRKHRSSIVMCVFVATGTCLPSRFLEKAAVYFAVIA